MTVLWAPDNTAHSKVKISVNILRPFPVFNKQDHQHSFTVTLSSMTGNVKPPAVSTDSSVCVLSVGLHDQLKVFFFFSFYSVPTNVSQWHLSQYYTKSNNNNKKTQCLTLLNLFESMYFHCGLETLSSTWIFLVLHSYRVYGSQWTHGQRHHPSNADVGHRELHGASILVKNEHTSAPVEIIVSWHTVG